MKVQRIDFTPLEAAENLAKRLETLAFKIRMGEHDLNYSILYEAAEFIRRVASGELAEVVPAHWVFGHTQGHLWMKCSHCLKSQSGHTATFDYCPNCGALMDGKDDSHE